MKPFVRKQTLPRMHKLQGLLAGAAGGMDADCVHDLRVAIRRMNQCFEIFAQFFDAKAAAAIRKTLKRVMRHCGEVRNCDIARELVVEKAGFSKSSATVRQLEKRREEAERSLLKALDKVPQRGLFKDVWLKEPSEFPITLSLSPKENAHRFLPGLARDLFAAGRAAAAPRASYESIHRFRIQAKHFRYTLELFESCFAKAERDPILASLRRLQDRLGELNDCVTTLELLNRHKRATRAIAKLLHERERQFRSYWTREFGSAKETAWISTFSGTARQSPKRQALRMRLAS